MFARTLLAAACVLPHTAYAKPWLQHGFGVDPKTCEHWAYTRARGPADWGRDEEWMFGFLTALVRAEGDSGKGGMTGEDFPEEIDALCKAHPGMDLAGILQIFAERHELVSKHIKVTE